MGEKDIVEKMLEDYNDVFADIVNTLLFGGEKIIDPNDLESKTAISNYKADGKVHELERDVVKLWKKYNIRIACIGLENQTVPDPYMILRVAGYDGTEYRSQLNNLGRGETPYPVVTLVLYFGYEKRWDQPISLYEALNVPDILKPYVNNMKLNLFEIAYLDRSTVDKFKSDFKVVADYFVQMRENRNYMPGNEELNHIQAVLQLLNVMDQDHRFEMKMNEENEKGKVKTMSEWLTMVINDSEVRGENRGEARGEARGRVEGENRFAKLIKILLTQGRTEDVSKAADDPEYRDVLYKEFQIA